VGQQLGVVRHKGLTHWLAGQRKLLEQLVRKKHRTKRAHTHQHEDITYASKQGTTTKLPS
jgi:hypothetical protein